MREEYKVFNKGFNKIFDLVETVEPKLISRYQTFIDSLPRIVLDKTSKCKDFIIDTDNYTVEMDRMPNSLDLDYIQKNGYKRTQIMVHRYFEQELFEQDVSITLLTFSQRNTARKKKDLQLFYEEINNQYKFIGCNDPDLTDIDYKWEVFFEMQNDEFYLISKFSFRGLEISCKKIEVSFDELFQCIETEDEYEEDLEIEFNPDFDL